MADFVVEIVFDAEHGGEEHGGVHFDDFFDFAGKKTFSPPVLYISLLRPAR